MEVFEGFVWKLYYIFNWLLRIMYINALWLLFSLLGLVLFGFFPATTAMFTVTRKWVLGKTEIPVFKTFVRSFRTNFLQINVIGFCLLLIGGLLYIDLQFFQASQQLIMSLLSFFVLFALLVYFIVLLYIFPVFVHFEFKTFEYIKYSIIVAIGKPLQSIMMIVGSFLVYLTLSILPVFLPFLSGSLLSIVLMWIAMRSFPKSN